MEETYEKLFIELGDAAFIPKENPFAFPMYDCLRAQMCVFDKKDIKFISTSDFVEFCERHFLEVDVERIKAESFKLEDRGITYGDA